MMTEREEDEIDKRSGDRITAATATATATATQTDRETERQVGR